MLKRPLIIFVIIVAIAISVAYVYRYAILAYSAEAAIRGSLPPYVTIDKIAFGPRSITMSGFRVANPSGFTCTYLIEIGEITCSYSLSGKTILDGAHITSPVFKRPVLCIERLADGRINLFEMQKVTAAGGKKGSGKGDSAKKQGRKDSKSAGAGDKTLADFIKLPQEFIVREGALKFIDDMVRPGPHIVTLENIDARLTLAFDRTYTGVLRASSVGKGSVYGRGGETVKWTVVYDPTTPNLTMSNRFEVSGVDLKTLEPYYDRYSPFVFDKGTFSGTLIFDFDNGNIGSTNEIRLNGLSMRVKQGHENGRAFQASVQDLAQYFTSSTGDVVFDFKIKGPMSEPQFFLGPISKQAVTAMAVSTLSKAIGKAASKETSGKIDAMGEEFGKVSDMVEAFKGVIEKK